MNARGLATATLGLGAAAEALRYTPKRSMRQPLLSAAWALHVLAVLFVASRSPKLPLPPIAGKAGTLLVLGGGALALYSAIGEHSREGRGNDPAAAAYPPLADLLGPDPEQRAALDTPLSDGTYRATRHPALLGYAAFLAGLALTTRSLRLLASLPLWIAAAVGQAALREEALRREHPWYDAYAKDTPMLLPTKEGVRAAMADLRARFSSEPPHVHVETITD